MPKEFTYSGSGVDRKLRAECKKSLIDLLKLQKYGVPVQLPFGKVYICDQRSGAKGVMYLDAVSESVGTKVLLAQLAEKYDTIGVDAVAMAVNDVIREGIKPAFVLDEILMEKSDPRIFRELLKGVVRGAEESEAFVLNGETGDERDVITGLREGMGFYIGATAVGHGPELIWENNINPRDSVIGARSTGVHSNGLSLAREVLFKEWGGNYSDPFEKLDELEEELVLEVLKPTQIYVKPIMKCLSKQICMKAAVHVTGDGHSKFNKLLPYNPGIGFTFNNLRPQPIYKVMQKAAREMGGGISDKEMLMTFNMGDGFDMVVPSEDKDETIGVFESYGIEAWQVGYVNDNGRIVAEYKGKTIFLDD